MKVWLAQKTLGIRRVWWRIWSKVYRWLFHRKYLGVDLDRGLTPIDAQNRMNKLSWTRDGIRELRDSVGSPHWVQYAIHQLDQGLGQPDGALDCDDFACWMAHAVDPAFIPRMVSVQYQKQDGSPAGHMVCMVHLDKRIDGRVAHGGNWGLSLGFASFQELLDDITRRAKARLIGWYVMRPDLSKVAGGLTRADAVAYDVKRVQQAHGGEGR